MKTMSAKHLLFTIILFFFISVNSFAQEMNFGVKAGANFSDYSGTLDGFNTENITSFHGGVFAEFRFARFGIQPEVLYSTQGAKLSDATQEFENRLGYLSIPVLARIYLIPNFISLDIGPQASFLMNETENVNIANSNTFDFAVCGGATVHFLGSMFFQARYVLGLTDVKPNAQVQNTLIQLSAGLRF